MVSSLRLKIPVILNSPDTANTGPGTISIVLGTPDSDALYEIDENNKSATATIVDTLLPKVSIEDASPTFNGTDIVFTLKSDIEVAKPFTIKVKPENSIGNFLDVSGSGRASGVTRDIPNVRFPRTSSTQTTFSHELRIPTVIDSTLVEGEIDIELIRDNSPTRPYNLSEVVGATTATAKVYRLTRLSIVADETEAKEGDLLTFTVTAENNPHQAPLTVNYTVQEVGSANFFDGTTNAANPLAQPPIPLIFTQDPETNAWTAPIEIQLRAIDTTDHPTDSTFTVELPQQSGDDSTYRVDTTANMNKASVTISDNSEPTISIADATPTYHGETAVFTLSSQIEVTNPLTVTVKITNASG